MKTRIPSEEELLSNQELRLKIIEEINGDEEYNRRKEAYKNFMILRGQNIPYIKGKLAKTYSNETMEKLEYAMTDIAVNKKVMKKLAKVYDNGANREVVDDNKLANKEETAKVQNLSSWLDMNSIMKTANLSMRQQMKITVFTRPYNVDGVDYVEPMILEPHTFSVIEHKENKKMAMCYILSDFNIRETQQTYTLQENPRLALNRIDSRYQEGDWYQKVNGDGKENIIADNPLDTKDCPQFYYFWTSKFHFITDIGGNIVRKENYEPYEETQAVQPEDYENPIKMLPFDDLSMNQDNCYWPIEKNNVADMDVQVNCLITNLNHIGTVQGYGKFYMKGADLPEHIPQAPDIALKLEYDEGDPEPQVGYVNSNPQLGELRSNLEMQVALLLSTNNLSVSSVKMNLGNGDLASGLSKILDAAESTEDIKDQRQVFVDKEPLIWEKIHAWATFLNIYGNLAKNIKDNIFNIELFKKGFVLTFPETKPIITESDHLSNLKTRKDLGLNTRAEIIMMDRRNIDEAQAQAIVTKIKKEKIQEAKEILGDEDQEKVEPENSPENQDKNQGMKNGKEKE